MRLRLVIASGLIAHIFLNLLILKNIELKFELIEVFNFVGILMGIYLTDFFTSFIHWLGDAEIRWKNPYLQKFHELSGAHHKNPVDILDKSYFDIKGNIAFFYMPPLVLALFIQSWPTLTPFVFMLVTISNLMLLAHSIHKWCHQKKANFLVQFLQSTKLIIQPAYHLKHHKPPYMVHFSGINGWAEPLFHALILRHTR